MEEEPINCAVRIVFQIAGLRRDSYCLGFYRFQLLAEFFLNNDVVTQDVLPKKIACSFRVDVRQLRIRRRSLFVCNAECSDNCVFIERRLTYIDCTIPARNFEYLYLMSKYARSKHEC